MLWIEAVPDPGLIEALVDCAADREESVRESIFKSIVDIGRKKHGVVLDSMHTYLSKHNKVGWVKPSWIIKSSIPTRPVGQGSQDHSSQTDGEDL